MWNKPLKVFKGVNNVFDIVIQDFDQQPVPVGAYSFLFRALDNNEVSMISKPVGFKPDSNNRLLLEITRDEIADLDTGFYTWGISLVDEDGRERPLYLELNGGTRSTMEIGGWSYADDALVSATLSDWTLDSNSTPADDLITDVVSLDVLASSQLSPLHTFSIFKPTTLDGTLTVEVSTAPQGGAWATAHSVALAAGTTSTYANFYGVYERVRFRFSPSPTSQGTPGTLYYRLF